MNKLGWTPGAVRGLYVQRIMTVKPVREAKL